MRSSLALSANARTVQSLEKLFPKLSAQGQQKRALSSAASVDTFFDDYAAHVEERKAQGIVPLPLNAEQVAALVEIVKNPPSGRESEIIDLLENRIPPGVDEAAYVKAAKARAAKSAPKAAPIVRAFAGSSISWMPPPPSRWYIHSLPCPGPCLVATM